MTTDKNNSCHPGATALGFKIAARLRGEKKMLFYKLFRLFPKELIYKAAHWGRLAPPCGRDRARLGRDLDGYGTESVYTVILTRSGSYSSAMTGLGRSYFFQCP
jgi:hypothetical protein